MPWIDENLNPFTGDWIAPHDAEVVEAGKWDPGKGGVERGKDYNHSTYCDLVISGLIGLRPRADSVVEVDPLLPEGVWDYFCLSMCSTMGGQLRSCTTRPGSVTAKARASASSPTAGRSPPPARLQRLTAPLRPAALIALTRKEQTVVHAVMGHDPVALIGDHGASASRRHPARKRQKMPVGLLPPDPASRIVSIWTKSILPGATPCSERLHLPFSPRSSSCTPRRSHNPPKPTPQKSNPAIRSSSSMPPISARGEGRRRTAEGDGVPRDWGHGRLGRRFGNGRRQESRAGCRRARCRRARRQGKKARPQRPAGLALLAGSQPRRQIARHRTAKTVAQRAGRSCSGRPTASAWASPAWPWREARSTSPATRTAN